MYSSVHSPIYGRAYLPLVVMLSLSKDAPERGFFHEDSPLPPAFFHPAPVSHPRQSKIDHHTESPGFPLRP